MASPIRTIFLGLLIVSILIYGLIATIGSFTLANNLPINSTLKQQYLLITGNASTYGGILGPVGNLQQTVSTNQNSLSNPNVLTLVINSLSLAANFFGSLPNLFNSVVLFAAIPLNAIGIPASFAYGISLIALIGLMGLGLISAIFLFPV